jgi:hypothetical protein
MKTEMQNLLKTQKSRNELTLDDKKDVLNRLSAGESYRKIQLDYKCSIGQISNIKNSKRKIEEAIEDNENPNKKRLTVRKTDNYDINVLVWRWFQEVRKHNIFVSGPVIRAKALEYATDLGIEEFKASDGWLEKFKIRHNIKFKQICGESASFEPSVANNWEENIVTIFKEEADPEAEDVGEVVDVQEEKRVIKSKTELRNLLDEYEYYIIEKEPDLKASFKQFQTAFLDKSNIP